MRMLDLFSGIGGFALGASWIWRDELELVAFCEADDFCQKILKKHWPDVPIIPNIRDLEPDQFTEIDLITAGFPCQDISCSGEKAEIEDGKKSSIFFELIEKIRYIRPRFIVLENTANLIHRDIGIVLRELSKMGYDAEWVTFGANEIGAKHKRDRVWIVAYPMRQRSSNGISDTERRESGETDKLDDSCDRLRGRETGNAGISAQCGLGGMVDGISGGLDEPVRLSVDQPDRTCRLKGLGNAIVPQAGAVILHHVKMLIDESDRLAHGSEPCTGVHRTSDVYQPVSQM